MHGLKFHGLWGTGTLLFFLSEIADFELNVFIFSNNSFDYMIRKRLIITHLKYIQIILLNGLWNFVFKSCNWQMAYLALAKLWSEIVVTLLFYITVYNSDNVSLSMSNNSHFTQTRLCHFIHIIITHNTQIIDKPSCTTSSTFSFREIY